MFSYKIDQRRELRLLEAHHAEALFSLSDRNRDFLRRWLPWVDAAQTAENTLAFIKATLHQFANGEGFTAGIWIDGKLAGVLGHHSIDWSSRTATLGYWLAKEHQGHGTMTLACEAVFDHAFNKLKLNKIVIRSSTENHRSRAIPERLGFTHEGTLRDAERLYDRFIDLEFYGCLQWDWEKRARTPLTRVLTR